MKINVKLRRGNLEGPTSYSVQIFRLVQQCRLSCRDFFLSANTIVLAIEPEEFNFWNISWYQTIRVQYQFLQGLVILGIVVKIISLHSICYIFNLESWDRLLRRLQSAYLLKSSLSNEHAWEKKFKEGKREKCSLKRGSKCRGESSWAIVLLSLR